MVEQLNITPACALNSQSKRPLNETLIVLNEGRVLSQTKGQVRKTATARGTTARAPRDGWRALWSFGRTWSKTRDNPMKPAGDGLALDAPAIERRTAREQQLFLLRYLFQGVLLTCFVMAVVVLLLWSEVDHGRLLAWYGLVVAVSLFRLMLLRRRAALMAADGPDEVIQLGLHTGAFASALVCSVAVIFAAQSSQPADLMIVIALLGGMAAGALGSLGALIQVYNLFLFALLVPPVIWLMASAEGDTTTPALMALVFLGSLLVTGRGYSTRLEQSYRLQFHNLALNEHLSWASAEAVDNSRKLELEVEQRRKAESEIKAVARRLKQLNERLQAKIVQRKKSEQAVRLQAAQIKRSEGRLRAVIENSFDGIITVDADARICSANPAAQRLLGGPEKLLLGRDLTVFLPGLSLGAGDSGPHHLRVKQGSDGEVPVSFAAVPLNATDEHGYVCVLRDETEAEKARQALLSARDTAESASRAKSEFLSSMSHELRTPLHAILGFAQLLEADPEQPLSEAQAASTNEINKAGWHLLGLIDDVLDLAQIEAGKLEIRTEEVLVHELVADAIALVEPMATEHQVSLKDETRGGDHKVLADPMRLKQVLINLLSNAIKYNRPGGWVRIEAPDCTQGLCRLTVSDTGIGLTPEQQDAIFDRFSRVADNRHQIEGVGVGLTITRKLVHGMGGEIGVRSRVGVGSSFWVDLPAIGTERSAHPVAASS